MEVAELRKIDRGRRAETDGKHRAEMDRQRRKKIKGGWETDTGRHRIHILHLQSQSHFAPYIPSYYYFASRLLYLASPTLPLHVSVA